MEKLYDSATKGDVVALRELLVHEPFLLERVSYTSLNNTPLHIAATKGHLSFVKEILHSDPHLAEELNSQQSSPLHLASARGHVDIVKSLFDAAPDMCLSRDSQGRNPIHLAAIKGHIGVLEELVPRAPEAARETTDRGLTVLHLCVKYGQLEALKFLVKEVKELIDEKNDDGDTILHMAVMGKNEETVRFLLSVGVKVNALNGKEMTALDVLIRSKRDVKDSEIQNFLKHGGGKENKKKWEPSIKRQENWLEKRESALMVVVVLIATIAFQIGTNPPGGAWQDDSTNHTAGSSIFADKFQDDYQNFNIFNTTAFITSLIIILLLMSGFPVQRRIFMWTLIVLTWIAIASIAFSYINAIYVLRPKGDTNGSANDSDTKDVPAVLLVWVGVMALLLLIQMIRLVVKLVKKKRKLLARGRYSNSELGEIRGADSSI